MFFNLLLAVTVCRYPFSYMNVTYTSCAVISNQALCVVRNADTNGLFPIPVAECGGLKEYLKMIREF
jgi:hypothetical protein